MQFAGSGQERLDLTLDEVLAHAATIEGRHELIITEVAEHDTLPWMRAVIAGVVTQLEMQEPPRRVLGEPEVLVVGAALVATIISEPDVRPALVELQQPRHLAA